MAYSPRATEASDDVAPLLSQANELINRNELPPARDLLERAISLQPKNQKVQSLLGMACFKLGHLERAAELYELLVRENPVEPTLRVNLGLVYLKMSNLALAIREFQAGVDLAPEHKKAHNYLGLALAQAGEFAAAREAFIAAGSIAMIEKMDAALAEQGRRQHAAAPPTARAGFQEIEPVDNSVEIQVPQPLPQRPVTTPSGSGNGARPPTLGGLAPVSSSRPPTSVVANLLPLSELANALRVDAPPAASFEVRGELACIRVAGEVLTRLDPLVSISGAVQIAPEMKRFRGRATDKPFGMGTRRFTRASGQGAILVATAGNKFLPVELGDGAAYFVEDRIFAFEEALTFENGRLPGKNAPDLNLIHLRGRGKVLLSLPGPLRSVGVAPEGPTVVAVDQLVGWIGSLTPKLMTPLPDSDGETPKLAVELSGEGFALLTLAEQTAPHVRNG